MKNIQVEYTDLLENYCLAGCFSLRTMKIYIHADLRKYPELHDLILAHEKEHVNNRFSERREVVKLVRDIKLDYKLLKDYLGFKGVLRNQLRAWNKELDSRKVSFRTKSYNAIYQVIRFPIDIVFIVKNLIGQVNSPTEEFT